MEKKKFGYNLNNFSQARMFIYALSIFMIVIFHSGLTIGGSGTFHQILTTTKSYLFYAVDIFFIMSGISLYFSYSKDENPIAFLKRRFKRLLPII